MLLIGLFLLLAAGAGVLGRVLRVSVWMLVPCLVAVAVVGFLTYTGRRRRESAASNGKAATQ